MDIVKNVDEWVIPSDPKYNDSLNNGVEKNYEDDGDDCDDDDNDDDDN